MIASDSDRILYDHKALEIPASTRRMLQGLRERGQLVVFAIGRDMPTHHSRSFLDLVNADARVEQNGAKVVAGGKVLLKHSIDRALPRCMLDYVEETGVGSGVAIEDEDYYINPEHICEAEMQRWGQCGRQLKDAWAFLDKEIHTVNFIGTEEETRAMERAFPTLQLRMFSVNYGADIIEKGISKAEGLKKLCAYYGLKIHDVYTFSDSSSNNEMLEEAGVGIATGSAKEELRAIADYVISPIDENGIWNVCKYF